MRPAFDLSASCADLPIVRSVPERAPRKLRIVRDIPELAPALRVPIGVECRPYLHGMDLVPMDGPTRVQARLEREESASHVSDAKVLRTLCVDGEVISHRVLGPCMVLSVQESDETVTLLIERTNCERTLRASMVLEGMD